MELFGVGALEALLVLVVALIVVGPRRFPEIARQGGRWYAIARRYATEVSKDVRGAVEELQAEIEEEGDDLRAIRDLGKEMDADLRASKLDVEEVGAETARAADQAGAPNDAAADATPDASANAASNDGEPAR
jgi:sec-independent protein translocase protein TatB